jgi:hypothetical protein
VWLYCTPRQLLNGKRWINRTIGYSLLVRNCKVLFFSPGIMKCGSAVGIRTTQFVYYYFIFLFAKLSENHRALWLSSPTRCRLYPHLVKRTWLKKESHPARSGCVCFNNIIPDDSYLRGHYIATYLRDSFRKCFKAKAQFWCQAECDTSIWHTSLKRNFYFEFRRGGCVTEIAMRQVVPSRGTALAL